MGKNGDNNDNDKYMDNNNENDKTLKVTTGNFNITMTS